LVKDLNILSLFNGSLSASFASTKSHAETGRWSGFKTEQGDALKEENISKSTSASLYLKHMIAEIMVLLSCNSASVFSSDDLCKDDPSLA